MVCVSARARSGTQPLLVRPIDILYLQLKKMKLRPSIGILGFRDIVKKDDPAVI